jgi:hypothetical protein
MKLSRSLFTLAAVSLLSSAGTFAAPTTKGNLKLYEPVNVQGKQLAPGEYSLQWSGDGPNVELTIASGRRDVATVSAQVVPVTEKNKTNGYTSRRDPDGTSALTEIFLQGRAYEIRVGEPSARDAQPSSGASNQ